MSRTASACGIPPKRVEVDRPLLIGRAVGLVDVAIEHPTVSIRHAKIFMLGGRAFAKDLHSSVGTFVDGERVHDDTELKPGCRLSIGPCHFVFDGVSLHAVEATQNTLALSCLGLHRFATHRDNGETLELLRDVSLAINPHELLCVIGPSGCGKSTLLSTLSGRASPDRGKVFYGGLNLHAEFDSLKHDLAVVPQQEALHGDLTVSQALWYAAGLRLPVDTSDRELDDRVTSLLDEVGLRERSAVRVRDLSGGQRKRLSLATEICHAPRVIFIDEVTSGLDELADADMMGLFREIADRGRTIICITHNTLNIERYAHRVVVLAAGGRVACLGTPVEVCGYFGIQRLGDIYSSLGTQDAAVWERAFRNHPLALRYVDGPLRRPLTDGQGARRTLRFKKASLREPTSLRRQLQLLVGRLCTLLRMNPRAPVLAVAQAVFVAGMLAAFFGDLQQPASPESMLRNCRTAAFLLVVSIFWLGCNNAAPEIAKERLLFERERAVAVVPLTYYVAKLVVLGGMAIIQAIVVYGLMGAFCNFPRGDGVAGLMTQIGTAMLVGILGTLVGLAISAVARTEEVAIRAVPMVLIPQIVLADVVADLQGWLAYVGPMVTTTYWAFRAFTSGAQAYVPPSQDPAKFFPALIGLSTHALLAMAVALAGLRRTARNLMR